MGEGPYGQPPVVNVGVDYARASSQVSMPAIFMMVAAGLSILMHLFSLALRMLGTSIGALAPGRGEERVFALFAGGLGIVVAVVALAINGFILYGASRMKNLEGYALAMTAAILSMVPCSCCCLISFPIGVWALVVLLDNNVKAAFRS